jgi:hypothetical protein
MMADRTTSGGTNFSMACHVTYDSPYQCTFDASFGLGRRRKSNPDSSNTNDKTLHDFLQNENSRGQYRR